MDDRFLHEQRREPDAGYRRALREQLRGAESEVERPRGFRFHPAFATALATLVVAATFTLPAVRVAAQSALDMFRVRSFAAVEIDGARMEQLKKLSEESGSDPAMTLFDKQEVLQEPGEAVEYPSAELAGSAAGLPGLRVPNALPDGLVFEAAAVTGQSSARMTLHTQRLQHVLDALGITDLRVPQGLDGQSITVRMPASVMQRFGKDTRHLMVIEGTSPEVALPLGTDMKQLGEIGLRVLGLDADEARRISASVDWRSTLLVPVPTNAASFRQVDVNGHKGLFIRMSDTAEGGRGHRDGSGAMVMWTEGERVLAVQGNLSDEDVLEVAQSLR